MKSFNKNNTLIIYYLLAVVISTVAVLPMILSTQGIISQHVSHEWHPVGSLGPIGAAAFVAYLVKGKLGLSNYLQLLWDTKFSRKLFLMSLSPILLFPVLAVIVPLFSKSGGLSLNQFSLTWWLSILAASVAYGVGEEAGWRCFALPRLQSRMNALWAITVLTFFHWLWHIPFFFYRLQFGVGETVGFFIGMLAGGIFMTYLYNESGGKTLLPILFHTTWNIVSQVSLATQPEITYVLSTVLMVVAVVLVVVYRPANLASRARFSIEDVEKVGNWTRIDAENAEFSN